MAMVKLWERSAIAKIAIKRGVHNTCNERMAEELKVGNPFLAVFQVRVCEKSFICSRNVTSLGNECERRKSSSMELVLHSSEYIA